MTDTEKREKIIKGLMYCQGQYSDHYCSVCPYNKDGMCDIPTCIRTLHNDAFTLVREVEPCEDAVSRDAVRKMRPSDDEPDLYKIAYLDALLDVVELPRVTPKAPEPRVLTSKDFVDNPNVDGMGFLPAWEENRHEHFMDGWDVIDPPDLESEDRRYWTSCPTDEQMEATPWDE